MSNGNGGFIPFTNDFMFSLVMKDPEICMEFLRLIMPEEEFSNIKIVGPEFDGSDVEIDTQAVLKFAEMAKGVRLDVYIKSQNSWAEIEMRNYTGTILPKGSRFISRIWILML